MCVYVCVCVCVRACVYPSVHIHVAACGQTGTKFWHTHMQGHQEMVLACFYSRMPFLTLTTVVSGGPNR